MRLTEDFAWILPFSPPRQIPRPLSSPSRAPPLLLVIRSVTFSIFVWVGEFFIPLPPPVHQICCGGGEGYIFCQIFFLLLARLCDLIDPLVFILCTIIYLSLTWEKTEFISSWLVQGDFVT